MKRVYGCIGLFIKHYTKMRTRLPKVGSENVKAAPFSNKRYIKGVPSLQEWYIKAEAYHPEAFNPGSMLPIIPNQSNLTS